MAGTIKNPRNYKKVFLFLKHIFDVVYQCFGQLAN